MGVPLGLAAEGVLADDLDGGVHGVRLRLLGAKDKIVEVLTSKCPDSSW
jgi:hypothetical protein